MKDKENKPIRIEDDLYGYVNNEWISKAVIPSDLPVTGGFIEIMLDIEKTLMADFDSFVKGEKKCELAPMNNAILLYKKALDVEAREKDGMNPLLPLLEKIKNIKNLNEFNESILDLYMDRVHFPFKIDVLEDVRDTSKQALSIFDAETIIPDKGMYDKALVRIMILKIYKKMASSILALSPLSKKEQKQYLKDTIKFDDLIRRKVLSPTEQADYVKLFNPMMLEDVNNKLNPFDLKGLLLKIYKDNTPQEINVCNPRYVNGFNEILNDETFELFIHWSYVNTILDFAPALSKTISDLSNMYGNKLMGVKENPIIEKQAYRLVSNLFDNPIGVYYGRTYFGEEAKANITDIVKKIIATYIDRVKNNAFLEAATKEKAILKLEAIKVKMGYPDNYDKFFDSLVVDEDDSFFDAMNKIRKAKLEYELDKFNHPTDFSKWSMPGHMVNACYDPFKNDITFPAAILQKPFYSLDQSLEENLGGIGAVIGHEISHAFDNNGSHFDEKGNLVDWWLPEDFKKFEELTEEMVKQYDGIIYHGAKVNGKLVVSENIADNGGMAVTLQIMQGLKNPKYDLYFTNWAKIWRQKAKENYIKLLMKLDVHSPNELRANITVRNFSKWYETFNVKETDKMFIEEAKRITIW